MREVHRPLFAAPTLASGLPPGNGLARLPESDENDSPRSDSPISSISTDDPKPDAHMTPYFRQLTSLFPRRQAATVARVPCKARGLTDTHDAQNAYIEIPPDALHGMLLACSHPLCVKSGRRFRYCSVCEGPVSKRNFNKRHSHGRLAQTSSESFDYVYAPKEVVEGKGRATTPGASKRQRLDTSGQSAGIATPPEAGRMTTPDSDSIHQSQSLPELAAAAWNDTEVITTDPSKLTTEERRWLQLFRNRPALRHNGDEMQRWMDSVTKMASEAVGIGGVTNPFLNESPGHHQRLASSGFDALEALTSEELSSLLDLQELQLGELTAL